MGNQWLLWLAILYWLGIGATALLTMEWVPEEQWKDLSVMEAVLLLAMLVVILALLFLQFS